MTPTSATPTTATSSSNTVLTAVLYDPPMCCSTGVCGADADPDLARVAGDVAWLAARGVDLQRVNLAQEPARFLDEPVVRALLERSGGDELPALVVNGSLVAYGRYPARSEWARLLGLDVATGDDGPRVTFDELPMAPAGACDPSDSGCC